jgi:tryptophanyl-tRNA synthetase
MASTNKKTIFSGVQPSGNLHIGNYIGALSKWVEMQDDYNCIFCVVDLHAITVRQDTKALNRRIVEIVKHYLASGINPEKSIIFQQSDVTAHAELAWILNCVARISDLNKMTQFKDKSGKNQENVSVGLFDYPVLMAADILLYQTDAVPVGDDQVQHVELTRTLGRRFNSQFSEVFKIPEVVIRKEGARIMSLLDPTKKMSKSDETTGNFLALSDTPEEAEKKIMRAVTDSGAEIIFDRKKKPALANLLTIYSLLDHTPIKELEKSYQGKGYADFKRDLARVVKRFLTEYHLKFNSFKDEDIKEILKQGAAKVGPLAENTLKKAKQAIGININ